MMYWVEAESEWVNMEHAVTIRIDPVDNEVVVSLVSGGIVVLGRYNTMNEAVTARDDLATKIRVKS